MSGTFRPPWAPAENLSRVGSVDLVVWISTAPRFNRVNCAFKNYGDVGFHVISISHSSVVVAKQLLIAISTISSIQRYFVVTVLQVSERLIDIECLIIINELSSIDFIISRTGSSTIDVAIPAFCLATDVLVLVILQHIASLSECAVNDETADVHTLAITNSNSSNSHLFEEIELSLHNAVIVFMLIKDVGNVTVSVILRGFCCFASNIAQEFSLGITCGQVFCLSCIFFCLSLEFVIESCTCLDGSAESLELVVHTEESLHVKAVVNLRNSSYVLCDKSLVCTIVCSFELVSVICILFLDFFEFFFCTEMKFVHLNLSSAISLQDFYLIICIFFGCLGAEAEVRGLSVNGMQTILTHLNSLIYNNPTFSVLGSISVAIEVSGVNLPRTPVTAGVYRSVVTCCQSVEERIALVECTEDDVGVAVSIRRAAPLGSFDCVAVSVFSIESNAVDEVAIEAIAELTYGVTAEQDVNAVDSSIDHILDVANLTAGQNLCPALFFSILLILNIKACSLTDSIVVELEVLHDVLMCTIDVNAVGSNVLGCVTIEPCLQVLRCRTCTFKFCNPFLVLSILLDRGCNDVLQIFQFVLEPHQVRSIR